MATWYDNAYLYRRPLSVDNSAGGTGTWSIEATIPTDLDEFWDNVQADGDDVFLTSSDGFTPIDSGNSTAIEIDNGSGGTFDGAGRLGRVRIDQYTAGTANTANFVWMYYGNAAATVNSEHGAWTTPSTVSAVIAREGARRISPRVLTKPEAPGAVKPRTTISKTTTETIFLYWDFSAELNQRDSPYNGYLWYEAIRYAAISAETGGAPAATVVNATSVIMLGPRGAVIRTKHPGGADATDYVLKLLVTTSTGRTFSRRVIMSVNDPVE